MRISLYLLIIAASLPFLGGLSGEFVQDDKAIIQLNPDIRDASSIQKFFVQTYWHGTGRSDAYRPLSIASFALDGALWGRDSTGGPTFRGVYLSNLLLHVMCVLAAFSVLRHMLRKPTLPFLAALIFAVHPANVESVVHLVGRCDLLMAFFFLLGLHFYLPDKTSLLHSSLAALLLLASVLSKEPGAMLLPAALLLYAAQPTQKTFRDWAVRFLPSLASILIYLALRGHAIGRELNPPQWFAWSGPNQFIAFPNPQPGEVFLALPGFGWIIPLFRVSGKGSNRRSEKV
jgi:hypothetical protein